MNVLRNGEIYLYGLVGNSFFSEGFTALDVADALMQIGRKNDVTVHLNSGGGIASEGVAIRSLFKDHQGQVKIVVDSVALSAASLLAMGADEVVMRTGSVMMIHDPSGITMGTSEEHQKTVEGLETMANSMAEIYAEKTGKTIEAMRDVMVEETWLTAAQAVSEGFADDTESVRAVRPSPFPYKVFKNAPERITALATKQGWEMRAVAQAPGGATIKEKVMTKTTAKGGNANSAAEESEDDLAAKISAAVDAAFTAREKAAKDVADKAKTDAEAATALKGGTETPEQMTARIRTEEQKRFTDITAACTLVGKPEKAAVFLAENKSLSEVVDALQKERAEGTGGGNRPNEISARKGGGGQDRTQANGSAVGDIKASWDRQTSRINKRIAA